MKFIPNYQNIVDCALNKKPQRIPLYEHNVSDEIMEQMLDLKFRDLLDKDISKYFEYYNSFWEKMGYDTVTFEACVTVVLLYGGALAHPMPGYIENEEKFISYPWHTVKDLYIHKFKPYFEALKANMPKSMKAIGGVGNGIFEIAQDLVGFENLCILSFEEPELYAKLFVKIGDLLMELWEWFLSN